MTISSTTNRVSYAGNGVTTGFAVAFPFHAQADLVVVATATATGVQTTKALTTDYTISGSTDAQGHYTSGGTVTALVAPASGVTWTIYRDPALTQSVDLVENDPLPVEAAVESPLDRLTMIAQRVREMVTRSLRQPEGDAATIGFLPAKVDRLGKFLFFNATTGEPEASAGTTEVPVSAFAETLLDDANAAAARTTLGLGTMAVEAKTITTRGDLIRGGVDGILERVALGASGTAVVSDGTDAVWGTPSGTVPSGTLIDFAGTAAPAGYLGCDGSNVSRTTYAALFTAIGTTWGVGDGSSTFTLPDFRRRVAVGSGGSGTGTLGNAVGNTGGAETHVLVTGELAAHAHNTVWNTSGAAQIAAGGDYSLGNNTTSTVGSSTAHNNMQPSAVVLKIIKT